MDDVGHVAVALGFGPLVLGTAWLSCPRLGGPPGVVGVVLLLLGVALAAFVGVSRRAGPATLAVRELVAGVLVIGSVFGALWVRAVCAGG